METVCPRSLNKEFSLEFPVEIDIQLMKAGGYNTRNVVCNKKKDEYNSLCINRVNKDEDIN